MSYSWTLRIQPNPLQSWRVRRKEWPRNLTGLVSLACETVTALGCLLICQGAIHLVNFAPCFLQPPSSTPLGYCGMLTPRTASLSCWMVPTHTTHHILLSSNPHSSPGTVHTCNHNVHVHSCSGHPVQWWALFGTNDIVFCYVVRNIVKHDIHTHVHTLKVLLT